MRLRRRFPQNAAVGSDPIRGGSKRERSLIKISLFALLISVAVVAVLIFENGEHVHPQFWVSAILFGTVLLYLLLFKWPSDPLNPVGGVVFLYLITFYIRAFVLYFGGTQELTNQVVLDNIDLLDKAMMYMTGGVVVYVITYLSPVPKFISSHVRARPELMSPATLSKRARNLFWLGLPFGWVYSATGFVTTLKSLSMICLLMLTVSQVGFFLYGMLHFNARTREHTKAPLFYFMLVALLLLGLATGYREPVVINLFFLVAARHYAGKRLKLRNVGIFVFIVAFIISPIGIAYRVLAWDSGAGFVSAIQQIPAQVSELVYEYARRESLGFEFLLDYVASSALYLGLRFHGPDSFIAIMARVPGFVDFTHGSTLFFLPISAFVPRILWPSKPLTGLGDYFRDNFWFGTGGSIAIGQTGEFYLNFGLTGILVGMAVLAVFHSSVYHYFLRTRTYISTVLLVFSIPAFLAVERDVSLVYATLLKQYMVFFFVFRYLRRSETATVRGPAVREMSPRYAEREYSPELEEGELHR